MELYIDIVNGWQDGSIYDVPVNGIRVTIDQLRSEGYEIIIYSTRCATPGGIAAMKDWLKKYNITVDGISADKPIAVMYVDDRAIPFTGNCQTLLRNIHTFKAWTEKTRKICPYCGEEFVVNGKSSNRKKYCSTNCRVGMIREAKASDY